MGRLYLDCEFNGHGGDLISLAIADPNGKNWYGVLPLPSVVHPWVAAHVVPYLFSVPSQQFGGEQAIEPALFRMSLHEYLLSRSGSIIYADWPGDFAHLMRGMEGSSYEQSWIVDVGMQLLAESEPKPEVPHNALSDAIALMEWHAVHG